MVALSFVPAPQPIKCDAKRLFDEAEAALDYGQFIECAAFLREGIRAMLAAMCEYHDVAAPRRDRATVGALVKLLQRRGKLDGECGNYILEAAGLCNRCVHLAFVLPSDLRSEIGKMRFILRDESFWTTGGAA